MENVNSRVHGLKPKGAKGANGVKGHDGQDTVMNTMRGANPLLKLGSPESKAFNVLTTLDGERYLSMDRQ